MIFALVVLYNVPIKGYELGVLINKVVLTCTLQGPVKYDDNGDIMNKDILLEQLLIDNGWCILGTLTLLLQTLNVYTHVHVYIQSIDVLLSYVYNISDSMYIFQSDALISKPVGYLKFNSSGYQLIERNKSLYPGIYTHNIYPGTITTVGNDCTLSILYKEVEYGEYRICNWYNSLPVH